MNNRIVALSKTLLARPERFFLTMAIVFGLPILLFRPAYDIPDFGAHLAKAYSISEGKLLPQVLKTPTFNPQGDKKIIGSSVPRDVANTYTLSLPGEPGSNHKVTARQALSLYKQPSDSRLVNIQYNTTAIYDPISYAPQAFSFFVGRLMHLSVYASVFIASLLNFVIWLLLIRKAIKVSPIGKWVIVTLNLLPMTLFIVPSISTDATLFGTIFLFFAYLVKYSTQRKLLLRHILPLVVLCFVLAIFKQTYFILLFAVLLLYKNFVSKKQAIIALTVCLLPGLLAVLIWSLAVTHLNDIAPWTDPHAQTQFLLHHPLTVIKDIFKTLAFNSNGFYWSFFGLLGLLTIPIPIWCVALLAMALVLALGLDNGDKKTFTIPRLQSYGLLGAFLANTALILGSLYLYWTAPGDPTLEGLQGRYFIPLVVFLVPLFSWFRLSASSQYKARITLQSILVVCLITCWYILAKFYYPGAV